MKLIKFFFLILAAIGVKYYTSESIATVFFISTLIAYFWSEDEPFWLAFFLVITDGFFGFFGGYEATLSAIPGLPAVQVGQFYIILTLYKAYGKKAGYPIFFFNLLRVLLVYLAFLILQGFAVGFSLKLNLIFRLLKMTLPFFLLYSLPRLLTEEKDYRSLFHYLFPVAFTILGTQVFSLIFSQSPPAYFGVFKSAASFSFEIGEDVIYRGFYNNNIILVVILGAMYFLASRTSPFKVQYLAAVLLSVFFAIFLSATRGWIISFLLILALFLVFVFKISVKRIALLSLTAFIFFTVIFSFPIVNTQFSNAYDRLMTVKHIAQGDLTAGNTLKRLTDRGPRIMKKWAASPLTGWGFSDYYFKNADPHVGNQNLLFHSGIIGVASLYIFFAYFCMKLVLKHLNLPSTHLQKGQLLVFPIFLIGWFFIHSTSGQQFGYSTTAGLGMIQAVLFSFAALAYGHCDKHPQPSKEKKLENFSSFYYEQPHSSFQ